MSLIKQIIIFYYEGFKSMTLGKTLWLIILIKLFIMFAILKVFFFPDLLQKNFSNDPDRAEYIIDELTKNP